MCPTNYFIFPKHMLQLQILSAHEHDIFIILISLKSINLCIVNILSSVRKHTDVCGPLNENIDK